MLLPESGILTLALVEEDRGLVGAVEVEEEGLEVEY